LPLRRSLEKDLSPLKILADENIESSIIKFLESKGFDVKRGPKGSKNSELLSLAEKEERVLLTHDHDFLRIDIVCQPTKTSFKATFIIPREFQLVLLRNLNKLMTNQKLMPELLLHFTK